MRVSKRSKQQRICIPSRFIERKDYVPRARTGATEDLHAIYSVLAKYLGHQSRIPGTQLQFWHPIRGIHQSVCICSDAVCDLMRLFETQADRFIHLRRKGRTGGETAREDWESPACPESGARCLLSARQIPGTARADKRIEMAIAVYKLEQRESER